MRERNAKLSWYEWCLLTGSMVVGIPAGIAFAQSTRAEVIRMTGIFVIILLFCAAPTANEVMRSSAEDLRWNDLKPTYRVRFRSLMFRHVIYLASYCVLSDIILGLLFLRWLGFEVAFAILGALTLGFTILTLVIRGGLRAIWEAVESSRPHGTSD